MAPLDLYVTKLNIPVCLVLRALTIKLIRVKFTRPPLCTSDVNIFFIYA